MSGKLIPRDWAYDDGPGHSEVAKLRERVHWVLSEIASDAESDVNEMEGQPFTGKHTAENFGKLYAAVQALANVTEELMCMIEHVEETAMRAEAMHHE